MKVQAKVLPPAYHLEFIGVPELASELQISKHALIRFLKRDGFLTRNNIPTDSMIQTGNMFLEKNENDDYEPMITSKGYFFFIKHFKKHLKRHQKRELLFDNPQSKKHFKNNYYDRNNK